MRLRAPSSTSRPSPTTTAATQLVGETPDGSWRWDTSTDEVIRLPGRIVFGSTDPLLLVGCDAPSDCHVSIDTGDGPTRIDWIAPSDVLNGSVHTSTDRRAVLIHRYADQGIEFSYVDFATGESVELGALPIAPYLGIAWITDSGWFVGRVEGFLDRLLAVDVDTGDQITIELPFRISTDMYPAALIHVPG